MTDATLHQIISDHNTRPFRFEDLAGKPEPILWGPRYPNLPGRPGERDIGRLIRDLQTRELCGAKPKPIDLRCTVRGIKYGPGEEEEAYQRWLVKLAKIRADRANPPMQPRPFIVNVKGGFFAGRKLHKSPKSRQSAQIIRMPPPTDRPPAWLGG
jgi:hypothetical protein